MDKRKYIIDKIDKIVNIKNYVEFVLKREFNPNIKITLNKNGIFKDRHRDERCFILGNGPSLKNESLECLSDEYTFTVNQMFRSPIFEKVNSNFHVIIDPAYFKLDPKVEEEFERINYIKKILGKNIPVFLHHEAKIFLKTLDINDKNAYYLYPGIIIGDNFNKKIDLQFLIPGAQTVVQTAIYIAIYMGFKEIYLLGCDMTGVFQNYLYEQGNNFYKYGHVYEYTNNEKKYVQKEAQSRSNELMLKSFGKMFEIYRKINSYALKNNIIIKNLTAGGGLDVFERDALKTVFSKKQQFLKGE